mgnify:CR=1 FL=1|tara:strand:+ start:144 stop:425 length:282 start_codon:yes stop_codon:yes gene_type:complete
MNSYQVKKEFKQKVERFYLLNTIMVVLIAGALWFTKQWGVYRQAFIPIVVIFFLWIFNIDKVYRCPVCEKSPRGKQGLIYLPKRCGHCGVELR